MSGTSEVDNHFSAPPFQYLEAKAAGARKITSAEDIFGAPATYMVACASEKFRTDIPKTYAAFVAALRGLIKVRPSSWNDLPGS
jgi:NitT/TauT family transport system substrate-binding protein